MPEDIANKRPYDFGLGTFLPFQLADNFGLRLILWASLLVGIIYSAALLLSIPLIKQIIQAFALISESSDDPEAIFMIMGVYFKFMGLFCVFGFCAALVYCAAEGAMHRKNLLGEGSAGFPLKFNGDMWRVLLAKIVVGLILYGAFIIGYILIIILVVAFAAIGSDGGAAGALSGLVAGLVILAAICALVYYSTRLVPVSALSIRDQDLKLGEAFKSSKGYFWPMCGGYILIGISTYIVQNVILYGGIIVIAISNGLFTDIAALEGASSEQVMAKLNDIFSSPLIWVCAILLTIVFSFVIVTARLCYAGIGSHVIALQDVA